MLNDSPSISSGLNIEANGCYWKFTWNPSIDDHTPQNGIRYNITIGTNTNGIYNYLSTTNIFYARGQATVGNVNIGGANPSYQSTIPVSKNVCFKVCAIDTSFKHSAYSTMKTATPIYETPTWGTATVQSSNRIDLTWNATCWETSYTLYRDTDNNISGAIKVTGLVSDSSSHNDSTLSPETTYYYWIKAYYNGGTAKVSASISGKTLPKKPLTPTWVGDATVTTNQINIIWNDLPVESSYTLFRDTDKNVSGAIKIGLSQNVTNYTDTGLLPDTSYYYWLKAYNASGESSYSTMLSNKTTPLDRTAPAEISSLELGLVPSGKGIVLTWKNPTDSDFAGIYIVRKKDGYPLSINDGEKIIIANAITTTYTDDLLEKDTKYYYIIYTYDEKGNISTGIQAEKETLSGLAKNQFKVHRSAINLSDGDEIELEYNAKEGAQVYFEIYTLNGDLVKKIPAQDYRGTWNGQNNKSKDVAVGFYLLMMRVDGRIVNKKPIKIGVIK